MASNTFAPPLFLIWCRSRRQWWKQNEIGYVSTLDEAGRFDPAHMASILSRSRDGDDFPIPVEFAEVIVEIVRVQVASYRRGMLQS